MSELPTPGDSVTVEEYPRELTTASINPHTISFRDTETDNILTIPHSVVEAGIESDRIEYQNA